MDALADVNVLLALADSKHKAHAKTRDWFDSLPAGSQLLICRVVQLGFLRLITSNTVMQGKALTMREAWTFYGQLIQHPSVSQISEPEGIHVEFMRCSLQFKQATKRVTDAYLAGLAITANIPIATLDKGFKTFKGLKHIQL